MFVLLSLSNLWNEILHVSKRDTRNKFDIKNKFSQIDVVFSLFYIWKNVSLSKLYSDVNRKTWSFLPLLADEVAGHLVASGNCCSWASVTSGGTVRLLSNVRWGLGILLTKRSTIANYYYLHADFYEIGTTPDKPVHLCTQKTQQRSPSTRKSLNLF